MYIFSTWAIPLVNLIYAETHSVGTTVPEIREDTVIDVIDTTTTNIKATNKAPP